MELVFHIIDTLKSINWAQYIYIRSCNNPTLVNWKAVGSFKNVTQFARKHHFIIIVVVLMNRGRAELPPSIFIKVVGVGVA